ncbi:T9SS type A sorting domain-containing protein [Phaeocystidibacter marisrubri]|uniref:T9SS type A sorting domain-containing protein n=1 Tax=Phaeocystidibacter marisrubri TaxID=1577780 RepID=A0A6L3ZI93_9FLAO|nr:T9SS type A sorting domain-containing protein [Phaeocystidibacter marisrubri]KAB2817557.1 T9SS type A sorting domain-containing protein [Phaeocystidibacter marisrubri]GGH74745.1 hypothetical protein GCM10011318_21060 [Phaeocystidibacter marisrubri]
MNLTFHGVRSILAAFMITLSTGSIAQTVPFEVRLHPISIPNLGGLQSYAFGQANGKWLIVGGRLDGLHRRQPWASFDVAGHNNQLMVIDPVGLQVWTASLLSLPASIREQLSSTNMEHYQEGDYLYCLGGYGYSATQAAHTTYDKLTAIHVPNVINAVINNTSFTSDIRQITDAQFQVTGGQLRKINDTYYLLGGQKFLGSYNPMGPNHGPGFTQVYTNAIRKFKLTDDGTTLVVNHLTAYVSSADLHRRDYNAEPQILPNGEQGVTMFSGVFQVHADIPYLSSVTVDSTGFAVDAGFQQYYNHYHCPTLPLYSSSQNEMHTVFFGGIAQYYDQAGTLVQDNNVPFVKTIARVTREANGTMTEYKLPVEMPALLGAGAEFIPNINFPHFSNFVFELDSLTQDSVLVGYIYGGISSSQPNIFFVNDGSQSAASAQIYAVYLSLPKSVGVDEINPSSNDPLQFELYPNPSSGKLNLRFHLQESQTVALRLHDAYGKLIESNELLQVAIGENHIEHSFSELKSGGVYFVTLVVGDVEVRRKLILE